MVHGKVPRVNYNYILDKMRTKLTAWKANSLSLAGRTTLVKSALASISVYTMHSQLLPAHICLKVDKISRDFLWGSHDDTRKPHLLNWETITLPKDKGGFNIRSARDNNVAMLSKLGWRILKEDKAPWCVAMGS